MFNSILGFEERITQLEDDYAMSNVSIGFNARLTNPDLPGVDLPIIYDNVMSNADSRYSPSTGIFTADTAGLYYFEQYWVGHPSYAQYLDMKKNGVIQCRSHGEAYILCSHHRVISHGSGLYYK